MGSQILGAEATLTINRQDYGVSWSKALDNGGMVVANDVKIDLNVEAKQAKPAAQPQAQQNNSGAHNRGSSDLLLPEKIAPLVRNTIFSGNIFHQEQVESTNSLAMAAGTRAGHAPDSAPEGSVFLAEEQTAGRGRGGHSWTSQKGAGIYCSFLIHPPMTPAETLWLSLISGVAVQDATREVTGLQADIRWPNDLLIDEKKFAGILTEMSSDSSRACIMR